jgi:hypothetical protein
MTPAIATPAILTKDELRSSLENEVRILLHLISKVEPRMLDYRPTPKQRRAAIANQSEVIREVVNSLSDADLRQEMEMFGTRATRGALLVNMVHSHYVAYRMQLFLYLKGCGLEELNTMDLWAGRSAAMGA